MEVSVDTVRKVMENCDMRKGYNGRAWGFMYRIQEAEDVFGEIDRTKPTVDSDGSPKNLFNTFVTRLHKTYRSNTVPSRSTSDVWSEVVLRSIASALQDPDDPRSMKDDLSPWGRENMKIALRWLVDYFKEIENNDHSRD